MKSVLDQALAHHRAGRLQEAEASYRAILTAEPDHADVLNLLAVLSAQRGQCEAAVVLIERAIQINPDVADYHNNRGEVLRALKRLHDAVEAYRQALALKPDYVDAHYNLAYALQEQGNLDAAMSAYRRVLVHAPTHIAAHNNLGILLQEQDKLFNALIHFQQARALDPRSAAICYNLGNALKASGKLSEAIAVYRDALALKPDYPEAHNNLGVTLELEGAFPEAKAAYEHAIALKPDYTEAYSGLRRVLREQGNFKEAIAVSWQLAETRSIKNNLPETMYSRQLRHAVSYVSLDDYYFQDDLIYPSDVFLASYPRSGNHFVRFILWSVWYYQKFGNFPKDFSGMKSLPDIHKKDVHHAATQPRIIKTHFPFDPRYRNVIHLVRDPRDVIASYYHYSKDIGFFCGELETFVDLFLTGQIWPCDLRFHSQSFTAQSREVNYIRISYEHLLEQPKQEICRLLSYLGWPVQPDLLEKLIPHASFANMVKLHDPESASHGRVFEDRNLLLRKGVAGGYKHVLTTQALARIEEAYQAYSEQHQHT